MSEQEYDSTDIKDWVIFGIIIVSSLLFILCIVPLWIALENKKYTYKELKFKYQTNICKHKELVLNTKDSRSWCMHPDTKAIYEIEE